jgi:hypothetical protein
MLEFLVGVEFAPPTQSHLARDRTLLAHAVPDLDEATILGIALCQVAVDTLTLVPDLAWDSVLATHRCQECVAEAGALSRREGPDAEV